MDTKPPHVPTSNEVLKQAEDVFGLSYMDEFTLYGAWRVVRKITGRTKMGSWRTTLFGGLAAALNYALVVLQNGTVVPQNPHDWAMLGLSAAIAGFSWVAKDSSVGSQPGDPPTPARVVGAAAAGAPLPQAEVAKSAEAVRVVESK